MPQSNDYLIAPKSSFDATADAIRAVNGTNSSITWGQDGFASAIGSSRKYTLEEINTVGFPAASGAITISTGTTLRPFLFCSNTQITSFSSTSITDIRAEVYGVNDNAISGTFRNCSNLVSVSLPNISYENGFYHADFMFYNCTKLETVDIPWGEIICSGSSVFRGCSAITKTTYVMPKLRSPIYGFFLSDNANVIAFDIGTADIVIGSESRWTSPNIRGSAFANDSNLNTLIFRNENAIRPLENINAFNGTPFASGKSGGTLYVPNSLKSAYQSATNWVTILGYTNNNIESIEGSQYENYYADGTAIPTT